MFFLVAAAVLVGAVAPAQLRITSFTSNGELTWTNAAKVGGYRLEWASSPNGSWNPATTNLAQTNRVTVQVPLSNSPALYRVVWMAPDPIGVWDYRGYDSQGT